MSTVAQYERLTQTVMVAIHDADYECALSELERLQKLCKAIGYEPALPFILANRALALDGLGRDQQARRACDALADVLESSAHEVGYPGVFQQAVSALSERHGLDRLSAALGPSHTHDISMTNAFVDNQGETTPFQTDWVDTETWFACVLGFALKLTFDEEQTPNTNLRAFRTLHGADEESEDFIELIALLDEEPREVGRIYRHAADILNNPESISASTFYLTLGLAYHIEKDGLPQKLSFSPNPPEETRRLAIVRYINRLTHQLAYEAGFEGVVRAGKLVLEKECRALLELISIRQRRGAQKANDVEVTAEIGCVLAEIELTRGHAERALEHLKQPGDVARKSALNDRNLAVRTLSLRAMAFEYLQMNEDAHAEYVASLSLFFGRMDANSPDSLIASLSQQFSFTTEEWLLLGNLIAGFTRVCSFSEDGLSRMNHVVGAIHYETRQTLTGKGHVQSRVLLALARQGSVDAAREAVIWTAQTGEPLLETAAFLYRCLLDDGYLEKVEVATLRTHLNVFERLGRSRFKTTAQLLVAEGVFRTKRKALKPIAEMLLRTIGDLLGPGSFDMSMGDLLLPCSWQSALTSLVSLSSELGFGHSLRPLLASLSNRSFTTPYGLTLTDVSVAQELGQRLIQEFALEGRVDVELTTEFHRKMNALSVPSSSRFERLIRPRGRELLVDVYPVHQQIFVSLSSQSGIELTTYPLDEEKPKAWLARQISTKLEDNRRVIVSSSLPLPFAGFEQAILSHDGTAFIYGGRPGNTSLNWHDSTSIVLVGDCWTSTQLSALRHHENGAFGIDMMLDAREKDSLSSGQWSHFDCVVIGVQSTTAEGVLCWDDAQHLTAEEIAFFLGGEFHGLIILLTEEREPVHDLAIALSDVCHCGVLVGTTNQTSFSVLGSLLPGLKQVTDIGDLTRALGRRSAADELRHPFAHYVGSGTE